MIVLAALVTGALVMILLTIIYNLYAFPRLGEKKPLEERGVSILIPARNEEEIIGQTVTALCNQSYRSIEILVLDDHSDDETAAVVNKIAADDSRVHVLSGQPLPDDWSGKNWACYQLAQAARYDLLLFTDADVQWQPPALAAVVAMQQAMAADLLTVWPTQIMVTWGERLIVPLMSFAVWGYLPLWLAHETPYPAAAAANGQCLLFQRACYQRIGGHQAVRNRVLDDVLLAQHVKAAGGRLRMADGAGFIHCRMYNSWLATSHGYAKNILAGHQNSPLLLIASTLFHLLVFVGPWLWLFMGFTYAFSFWPQWPLLLIGMGLLARFLCAQATNQRRRDIVWMPIAVLLMSYIAGKSLWWHYQGGPRWKGRILTNA